MKRHSLLVVVGLSLALGFVVRELSVQVTLAQGQGRGQQSRPGHQPDGSFVGPDGTHYVSQQDFVESGLRCGTREADDVERSANEAGRGGRRWRRRHAPSALARHDADHPCVCSRDSELQRPGRRDSGPD